MPFDTERPNRIRELREAGVRLSQADVAKLIGIDVTTVSRHEAGRGLTPETVEAYAKALKVSSYELFVDPDRMARAGDGTGIGDISSVEIVEDGLAANRG